MRNILLLLVIFYTSCINKKDVIVDKSFSLNKEGFTNGYGEMDGSLEIGRWSYRKDHRLMKQGRYKDGYKVGTWNYYEKDKVFDVDWNIHQDKIIKVNYPKKWKIEKNSDYLFYALPDEKERDFFLILRHNKKVFDLELNDYLKKVFDEIVKNTKEKVLNYNLLKLKYENRAAYYFTLITEFNQDRYTYLAFYTEDAQYVYDFTFKFNNKNNIIYNKIFGGIVYGFSTEGQKLFYNNDVMINTYNMKIGDIE